MDDLEYIYNAVTDVNVLHFGKNLPMIMENGSWFPDGDRLLFNCCAGDGRYCTWEINQTCKSDLVDASDGALVDHAIFNTDMKTKSVSLRSSAQPLLNMIWMLNKDRYDMATKPGGSNAAFYNRKFKANSDSTYHVGNIDLCYVTKNAGAGIALSRDADTYLFMSSTSSTFWIPDSLDVVSLQKGYYDGGNVWVNQGNASFINSGHNKMFNIGAYECIRLQSAPTP